MRPQLLFTVIVAAALLAPAWLVSSHPAVGQGGFRALGITHDVLRGKPHCRPFSSSATAEKHPTP